MKFADKLRLKSLAFILGCVYLMFVLVLSAGKYIAGFEWMVLQSRLGVILASAGAVSFIGFVLIWIRLRPWSEYYRRRGSLDPSDPVIAKSFELAYGYPAMVFVDFIIISMSTTAFLAWYLSRAAGQNAGWLIFIPSAVAGLILAGFVFYQLKRLFRPVLFDLITDRPELLLGRFEKSFKLPGLPPLPVFVPVRIKLFGAMSLLGMVGVFFFFAGIRQLDIAFAASGDPLMERLKWIFAGLLAGQAAVTLAVSYVMSTYAADDISHAILEIRRASESIRGGNLKDRARVVTDDEICDVSAGVNLMCEELVKGLEDRVRHLEAAFESSERLAREIQTASHIILEIMDELSGGSERQRGSVTEANRKADDLGQSSNVIAKHARQIESLSSDSLNACENGSIILQGTVGQMEKLRGHIHQTADVMGELMEQARRVSGVIELIDEISDQINLISLNASLEAAGAGEAGKRFNVVAQEITRLAERSLQSTELVSEAVSRIIRSSSEVAGFAETGKQSVDQTMVSMEEVGVFLVKLFERVESVSRQVLAITGSTEKQSGAAMELAQQLGEIEDLAVRVESGIGDIRGSISELDRIADQMTLRLSSEN